MQLDTVDVNNEKLVAQHLNKIAQAGFIFKLNAEGLRIQKKLTPQDLYPSTFYHTQEEPHIVAFK
ncbi:MAG: hypothetical protein ACK4M7_02050 [Burkholderiales bacterium]